LKWLVALVVVLVVVLAPEILLASMRLQCALRAWLAVSSGIPMAGCAEDVTSHASMCGFVTAGRVEIDEMSHHIYTHVQHSPACSPLRRDQQQPVFRTGLQALPSCVALATSQT
jgi:hypothetical protein